MNNIVVMDFSGVYSLEHFPRTLHPQTLDCRHMEGTDCYCAPQAEQRLLRMISPLPLHAIHFVDSGDYHYMTKLWTDRITRPFSLILFDHHPDMQPPCFGPLLSCGGWVKDMLDLNPLLHSVVIIGVNDRLIPTVPRGYEDRVRFYTEHALEHHQAWKQFREGHLDEPVYISIDKDVLSPRCAVTNWDQGSLSIEELMQLLDVILNKEEVLGIDICGECTPMEGLQQKLPAARIDDRANRSLADFLLPRLFPQTDLRRAG